MGNLRIVQSKFVGNNELVVQFTNSLNPFINTSNIIINNVNADFDDIKTLKVTVKNDTLNILTDYFQPYALYNIVFQSTDVTKFKSKNGTDFLLEDGTNNILRVTGPQLPDNSIRSSLQSYLKEPYDVDDQLIIDLLNSQSDVIARGSYDIKQLKNDNYLSLVVENEKKTRGSGPFDRLNEEGAFELLKVSRNLNERSISDFQSFSSFPAFPISLQATSIVREKLVAGTGPSTFNKLLLNLKYGSIIKVTQISIIYNTGEYYIYPIDSLGYQIKDNRYDPEIASSYLTLEDNQVSLAGEVLNQEDFRVPQGADTIYVDYQYKALGKIIQEDSVIVSQTIEVLREPTPPITTSFNLSGFPVVSADDIKINIGGVQFLDSEANPPFSDTHPAFAKEISYRLENLPSYPGEYSVDYSTGTVFVYGAINNDGTGDFPPVASYFYRKTFVSDLDYTYDSTTYELVRSPIRTLEGETAKISFDYQMTLVPNVDFIPQIHNESLNERVGNKVNSTNTLKVTNGPITNVFRIFNETTGEVYRIDGWYNKTIYFTANNPPTISSIIQEKANFTNIVSETLIVNQELFNTNNIRIFEILLNNNNIIGNSEDSIGSSFNSSVSFSQADIFTQEIYFDAQTGTLQDNLDRLEIGLYEIDYRNGVIYVAVTSSQLEDVGTVNYKKDSIITNFDHIFAVQNISYYLDNNHVTKLSYSSFSDTEILPLNLNFSDESFINGDTSNPLIVSDNTITVTNNIKEIRGIYDHYDLTHNDSPINFGSSAEFSSNVITLSPVALMQTNSVVSGPKITIPFISAGAEIASVSSVLRLSDNAELFDSGGSISGYDILLSGVNSPATGDAVLVSFSVKLNGAATPIIDYSVGDLLIDYQYINDEILVSYEYGDNCIDFSAFNTLNEGETYYVSYKVGALRDALLKNFGALVNIPILNNLDTTLPRERYRDALSAALQSFTKGPTIPSLKTLVSSITHIQPEIIEAIFEHWVLGFSYLDMNPIKTTGDLNLLSGRFDNGVLIENENETISFPVSSNLRLEEGSLETWIIPEWDGLDNDALLSFSITRNDINLTSDQIFVGTNNSHPTLNTDFSFDVKKSDAIGLPSSIFTSTGFFIFYDTSEKIWKLYVKEKTDDNIIYKGTVQSSGEVYNVKFISGLGELNDVLKSGTSKIYFEFNIDAQDASSPDGYVDGYADNTYYPSDGYTPGYSFDGISFMADNLHYIFDFGEDNKNRFSLFKDGSGYIVFGIKDKKQNYRYLSKDISDWKAGEKHHVGISWRINSGDQRDEIHLFVDGFEVPNILKYGGRPQATDADRFRSIKPEILLSPLVKRIVIGADASLIAGSSVINFTDTILTDINPGDTIQFLELGLGSYSISSVGSTSLTIATPSPVSFDNAKFTINPYTTVVSSRINLYKNIIVSLIRGQEEIELPGLRADTPYYSISQNALNQDVLTILGGAEIGDQIAIRTLGLNYQRLRERQFVWGNSSILKTQFPAPITLNEVNIYAIPLPLISIGPDNAIFGSGVFTASDIQTTQPTNSSEGRTLAVRITSSNTDFSTPVSVTIKGSPSNETLVFNSAGTQNTTQKFTAITGVDVIVTPLNSTKNSTAIEIKEAYTINYSEGNSSYPVLRYSTQVSSGTTLSGSGDTVQDLDESFIDSDLNQYLVISSPAGVAGTYSITNRIDANSVQISPSLATSFTNGSYKVYHVALGTAGFANGFFTFEDAASLSTPYNLPQGLYELDYVTYLTLPFEPLGQVQAFVGSDKNGLHQAKATLDEFRILSKKITDVRVGETGPSDGESFTTDYTRISPFTKNKDTLMLLHFDEKPFVNDSDYWIFSQRDFIQSSSSVNDNFSKSLLITNKPYVIDNEGVLSTLNEGTIEFWVSPKYDTLNDPNTRYYFDASAVATEQTISITSSTIKISGRIQSIDSIRLITDTKGTGINYAPFATIQSDNQTIKLTKALPNQNTPLVIAYIPNGVSGDRISIYKDPYGFLNFEVKIADDIYSISQFIVWARETWHRIKVTYKFNRKDNRDELRLFVDGEEGGTITFGSGFAFGQGIVFGQRSSVISPLITNLDFQDNINELFIGTDYLGFHPSYARFDNLRFSNKALPPSTVAGQFKDLNYNSNTDVVLPVVENLYTTELINFDTILKKNKDFAILRDEAYGIFNFTLNIIDSFGIVSSNSRVQQILETLINILKPATSKVTINYLK